MYFRHADRQDTDEEDWKGQESQTSDPDPEEVAYAQLVDHINAFLPVKELAGREIDVGVLKQFGLVDSRHVNLFLASAFTKGQNATRHRPSR